MSDPVFDRAFTYFNQAVESVFPNIDFMSSYQAKILSQSADLKSVDIQPIDTDLPGMNAVPIFIGVAGITIKIIPQTLCMLAFNGGSPSGAYVYGFSNDKIQNITITDINNDTLTMGNGSLVFKSGGTTLIDASMSAIKIGANLIQTAVLTQLSTDSFGIPITNCPTNSMLVTAG
jgi:hypothetical protein